MATTTTLGKVSLTMGGNYSATAVYDRLTVVRGVNGNSYVSLVDGVSGISPGVTSGWQTYWQLFAEDGSGGGGGRTVTVTQVLTSGTKIATIGVDGTDTDLFAPSGGGGGSTVSVTQIQSTGTKIATITVDGNGTDLYSPDAPVTDVQVNGTSVVTSGVANIPIMSSSVPGVAKTNDAIGLKLNANGEVYIYKATDSDVKSANNQYRPIVSYNQHRSVFYGLAKAAGDSTQSASSNAVGTYTDSAKTAIKNMIGVGGNVYVSGETAYVEDLNTAGQVSVVTPASGSTFTLDPCPVTYSFGEKAELTLTVTATTQYHFMFSCPSGAATVLTMNGITGTSGDTLAAGKTYEVDIWAGIAFVKEIEVTAVT